MVHGLGEHGGCYDILAEKFSGQSVGFLSFDMRGHGTLPGIRGHSSAHIIKNDLLTIIKNMREKFPDIPIVLFGHSMGGQIVLTCAFDNLVNIQGVISSSPWLKLVNPPFAILIWLARWASPIVPWITVRTRIRGDQLSPNKTKRRSKKKDPLLHRRVSIKLFSDLIRNGEKLLSSSQKTTIPLLLMHGTDDPLTSYQASMIFAQNSGQLATFKGWDGMYHDLLNNDDSNAIFQYVMNWISNHILENGTVSNSSQMQ